MSINRNLKPSLVIAATPVALSVAYSPAESRREATSRGGGASLSSVGAAGALSELPTRYSNKSSH